MSALNYFHIGIGMLLLLGAVSCAFSQRLFGRAAHWPLLWGAYAMSPFSRRLQFIIISAMALWKIADGFFHIGPSFVVAAISILALISLAVAYRHDRRLSRTNVA